MGELLGSRNDDGLDFRGYASVSVSYGALIFKIEHIPHSPDNMAYAQLPADFYCETVVGDNIHPVRHAGSRLAYDINLLLSIVEAPLVLVYADGDHHLVKHGEGTFEYVEMARRERVERPWE